MENRSPRSLTAKQLFSLGNMLAKQHGLPGFARAEIAGLYNKPIPIPIIKRTGSVTLWLDRYYAAVKAKGAPFRYVYLTDTHISEERASYKEAAEERSDPTIKLPSDIQKQFKAADQKKQMGCKFWVDNDYQIILEVES